MREFVTKLIKTIDSIENPISNRIIIGDYYLYITYFPKGRILNIYDVKNDWDSVNIDLLSHEAEELELSIEKYKNRARNSIEYMTHPIFTK